MIVIEGTLWPVIFLGAVNESSTASGEAFFVTEELLEMSERLAIGVVVAGTGGQGMRSQHAALGWLESHRDLLTSRALRLAWVIEDERIRACTNAWLSCMGETLFTVRSLTFHTVQTALSWLLETPWPLAPGIERLEPMDSSAPPTAVPEPRRPALVSRVS